VKLSGTEASACRKKGSVQLSDGVVDIIDSECWLLNVHIADCPRCAPRDQHENKRARKLLLTRKEIMKLEQRLVDSRNYELVPIKLFYKENFIKLEFGVGKQKNLQDKRDDIMKREGNRSINRSMKSGSWD
jgi:SsrA-binding protein